MNDNVEKQLLIGEIILLRVANCKARGLPSSVLGNDDDLSDLTISELREIEERLKDITRSQGGLH